MIDRGRLKCKQNAFTSCHRFDRGNENSEFEKPER